MLTPTLDLNNKSMKTLLIFLLWSMAFASAAATTTNDNVEAHWHRLMEGPHVKQGVLPEIKLKRTMTASAEEEAQIKKHIANLAKIDHPDIGLSGTMSGSAFAPISESGKATSGALLTNHQLQTSDDFNQLVAFGPRALPFLLEALNDKTPTKLKLNQGNSMFTVMELATELSGNPTNSLEQKAIRSLPKRDWDRTSLDAYTVKVGDVCFVAIGQIVGRSYQAVRYQPSAIIIVNSPVEKNTLAQAVRNIWSSTNAAQCLFNSLLFDYSTEGVFNGESLDGWSIASDLQCQAAMRMLYYFPNETSQLIAERLARLDVRKPPDDRTHWLDSYLTNGVRAEDFIKAVAWSHEPAIRQAILNIFKRTTDSDILLAALPGIDTDGRELVRQRVDEIIDKLPADEPGPYGEGYKILVALGEKLGTEAKPTFIRYLQNASLQRWRSMSQVLRTTRKEWAVELLLPALKDRREFGWSYALIPGQNEPRRNIRVCDEAAETISLSRPDLPFKMEGEHENLDKQIAAMLAGIKSSQP